jgi:arylsulfatase A-like enzyme
VDTLPTVSGLLGLSLPGATTGGMNLAEYCSQGDLPVRKHAEAFDIHDLTRSIIHSDYLYVKFREDYRITSQWSGKKDAEFLFKRDDSPQGMVLADHPEQLQRMRKMLGESQDSELLLTRRRLK